MAVKLVAEARQEILVEDQVRLRVLAHETFLELATPLQTFNDRLFKLLDDYELLPATGNILDQFYADIGRLCDWFEVEIYDAMVNANLNILETVEKDLAVEYVIMGRYTSAAMKSDDMPTLSTDWRKPFHPKKKITKTFGISVNKANARILKAMGHNAYDPEVADRMLQNPLVTAKNFSRATREQIKNIMYKGIQRGEPIPTTSARVRQIIPKRNYNRALQIVWTETHNTMNFVKWKEYMKDDAIEHIQWITVGDRRVRPTHRRNHLQIIKKGETFRNGQRFPGDRSASIREWIRCRCTLTPYILEPSNVAHPRTRTPMQMVRYKKAGWRPTPPKVPETLRRGYRPVLPSVEIVKPAKPRETVVEKPVEPIKPGNVDLVDIREVVPAHVLRMLRGQFPTKIPAYFKGRPYRFLDDMFSEVSGVAIATFIAVYVGDDHRLVIGPWKRVDKLYDDVVACLQVHTSSVLGSTMWMTVAGFNKDWEALFIQ